MPTDRWVPHTAMATGWPTTTLMAQQSPEESTAPLPLVPAPHESASTFYSDTENSFPLLQVDISQKRAYDWFSKSPLGVNSPARRSGQVLTRPAACMMTAASGSVSPAGATPIWPRGQRPSSARHSVLQEPKTGAVCS